MLIALALFSLSANALELHYGLITDHPSGRTYERFYEREVEGEYEYKFNAAGIAVDREVKKERYAVKTPYNENNELLMLFTDDGWGIGHMYNSFNVESWILAKKFDHYVGTGYFNTKIKAGTIVALMSGYEDIWSYDNYRIGDLLPVAHAWASVEKGRFGLNATATFDVVTVNGSIAF